jgi:hypothetical protein
MLERRVTGLAVERKYAGLAPVGVGVERDPRERVPFVRSRTSSRG